MLTVHLRVSDAATGHATPVRLRIEGPAGETLPPLGRLADFAPGPDEDVGGHLLHDKQAWCFIDGTCEVRLPAGVPVRVRATKGPEFVPLDETVTLGPGQMSLRFSVSRWSDLRADGWHPGDARCHSLSPHSALLEAEAEDLSVVQLLAREGRYASLDGHAYPSVTNIGAFSGQGSALASPAAVVAVNTLNRHPVLGTVGLLHCHRPVFPLAFGGPDHTDDWSVCDWCDQCHRKNGLVTSVDPFGPAGGEALVALLLGKVDAVEADDRPRATPLLPWYYRLLDLGVRVPLVGASGKDSNSTPLGRVRTYARLPAGEPVTLGGWVEAVRAGRCFATAGPLVTVAVEGRGPGETVPAGPVAVTATADSLTRFDRLEVVADGEVLAAAEPTVSNTRWAARVELSAGRPHAGWLAARTVGRNGGFAHTAPVWVAADGVSPNRAAAVPAVRRAVEAARDWVTDVGRFADPASRDRLLARCQEALGRL